MSFFSSLCRFALKKHVPLIIVTLLAACSIGVLVLGEIGILYLWKNQGKCYVGAYYYPESSHLVEGVKVTITDFYGLSQEVTTSSDFVYVTLYFKGWYKIEATYGNSTETAIIITVKAQYAWIGTIYAVLNEDNTIRYIKYVSPLPI